jgi:tight adherence protein B
MFPFVALIGAAAAALSILCLAAGVYRLLRPAGELEARLQESVKRVSRGPRQLVLSHWISSLLKINMNWKFAGKMAVELEQADLSLTVNEYVLIRFGGAIAGALLGILVLHNVLFSLVLAMLVLQLPVLIVRSRFRLRQQRFQAQLVDVITMLGSGLKAGVGLMQAMDLVRREMPAPAGQEFGRVLREVGLGVSLSDALAALLRRMPGDDLAMVVTVINIQAEVGGNLANILEGVVTTIRERIQVAQEIRTLTAQQRMTGYVLAGLPFLVGGAIMVVNPGYMRPLLDPKWMVLPISAAAMVAVGFVVIGRLVDIKV